MDNTNFLTQFASLPTKTRVTLCHRDDSPDGYVIIARTNGKGRLHVHFQTIYNPEITANECSPELFSNIADGVASFLDEGWVVKSIRLFAIHEEPVPIPDYRGEHRAL